MIIGSRNISKRGAHVTKSYIVGLMVAALATSFITTAAFAILYETTTVTYPYYAFLEDKNNPWATVYDALDATGEIEYSDEFFLEPSPGDHPELRAASYALALAGYENQKDGYPADSANPYPKLKGLLDQMGFSDYQSWDIESEVDGHSMGATIGHKTLVSGEELVVIAPRNYNYMTEWLSNFNVGVSGDHAGFSESASFIKNDFDEYLSTRNLTNYKLWVVGYSRGGAVVDLFAKTINENIGSYNLAPDDFYAYTFGAPRASVTAPGYTNIHDVKDGNDLLLGYVFPELWGFYNTGTYEEINPADLEIPTTVVNIAEIANPATAMNVLINNDGLVEQVGVMNGREYMDSWVQFVNSKGLTREYFNNEVKTPLSKIMQLYQNRQLDKQSEFTGFFSDINEGLAGMVAGKAFQDLITYGFDLTSFPAYLDLVKILKGTATDDDINELVTILAGYMGEYSDYEAISEHPAVSDTEFGVLKEYLPKLVKALAPLLVADAAYTQSTFGEDYSLYYTYTLVSNAEKLVYAHIPESIMPKLKLLIPEQIIPLVPDTGVVK